jgi:hypothetical protein
MGGWVDNQGRNMHTVQIPQIGPANPNHNGSVLAVIMVDANGAPIDLTKLTAGNGNTNTGTGSSSGPAQFVFTQTTPSSQWAVNHNLGKMYPFVVVIDNSGDGEEGIPDIEPIDINNLNLLFATPISGTAYLS